MVTNGIHPGFDWKKVAKLVLVSRAIDDLEERRLVPERKVLYQFSARGHDVAQVLLGSLLDHAEDAACGYYRSRPFLLALGLTAEDAIAAPMGKSGGFSDGRDIGVVCNLPNAKGPKVLPMAGGVGTQYTVTAGWAQALQYRKQVLKESACDGAIAVVLGGDGSVATNGFWASLTMATTLSLPMIFYIEDNGLGLSVPSTRQTPGGNIAKNLASFQNLTIKDGDGSDPVQAAEHLKGAVDLTRAGKGPVLVRLTVPRLSGHSYQDNQAYKSKNELAADQSRDPLPKLKNYLVPKVFPEKAWEALEKEVAAEIETALQAVVARPDPDPKRLHTFLFADQGGGTTSNDQPRPEGERINLMSAIRRTLDVELSLNPQLVVFGEDVGPKGGVHAVTLGLLEKFGETRVFNTSLSEEGIIGRAVGMSYAGIKPVAEIQFRKYADPAQEQLNDCGTVRWRTANRFSAPIIVRMPVGFGRCGDPWHSVCNEVQFAHMPGWKIAFPSNAEDAVGLLRSAMRGGDPTVFFEHRYLLDAAYARRPYPGDHFELPFGVARTVREGDDLTIVSWGGLLERVEQAVERSGVSAEIIDLRTIIPWDKTSVIDSVGRTGRCLIVHEDTLTAGFGAEIAATLASEAFLSLKGPIERLAVPDIPLPYNLTLLQHALPTEDQIREKISELMEF